jgi:16S rRNA (uracil1498-N3)-methyltransferase
VRILLSETEQTTSIAAALKQHEGLVTLDAELTHALAIGPEGGWTQEEMVLFTQHGWQHVTLGPRILRAETAAIAALAILSSHFA